MFPTAGCNPKLDFPYCLKAAAERATLDEDNFWLHKLRATFATRCLLAGVDLRTVQQLLFRQKIKVELSAGTDVDDFGEVAGNIVRVATVALGKGEGQLQ